MTASTFQFQVVLIEITNLNRSCLDRNYEPGSVLNCASKLCAFFQKDLNYEYNQILRSLCISLLSESLIEKFQTLTKYLTDHEVKRMEKRA